VIDEGKTNEARDVLAAIAHHGEAMSKTQAAAAATGERSAWTRAFRALEVEARVDNVTLTSGTVLRDPLGHWWLEVRANGRTFALMGRADLEVAARDLFEQVHVKAHR
jgi:hypothetical protein